MKLTIELPEIYCLGVHALGQCGHDLANPSLSFFSIGQLASVITLLLAFSQLAKPIIRLRLATQIVSIKLAYAFVGVAIILVFVAAILRMVGGPPIPVIGYPVVWELLAGLLIVVTGLFLVRAASSRAILSTRNAVAYFAWFDRIVATGHQDDLRDLADEFTYSLDAIVAVCAEHQRRLKALPIDKRKFLAASDHQKICHTILDLAADQAFCKVLITRSPSTAIAFLGNLTAHRLYESAGYAFVQGLIEQAFCTENSILYREGQFSGLGRRKRFLNAAFSDPHLVSSRLRPLQAWDKFDLSFLEQSVERFSDALLTAIQGAVEAGDPQSITLALGSALDVLNSIGAKAAYKLRSLSESEVGTTPWLSVLGACARAYEMVIQKVAELTTQPPAPELEIDPKTYNRFNPQDRTLHGAVAHGLFGFFESLAVAQRHDETIRITIISLWMAVFDRLHQNAGSLEPIRKRFLVPMRRKVAENLDPDNWYYPLVVRTLIGLWGIPNVEDGEVKHLPVPEYTQDESGFHLETFQLIQRNYMILRAHNLEFAELLLPEHIEFSSNPPSLRQSWFRGTHSTLPLIPFEPNTSGGRLENEVGREQ